MDILLTIKLLLGALLCIYALGLIVIWIYEIKMTSAFRRFQQGISELNSLKISMAVLHARIFKLQHDYRRKLEYLTRSQQFILKILLVNRKFIENKKRFSLLGN